MESRLWLIAFSSSVRAPAQVLRFVLTCLYGCCDTARPNYRRNNAANSAMFGCPCRQGRLGHFSRARTCATRAKTNPGFRKETGALGHVYRPLKAARAIAGSNAPAFIPDPRRLNREQVVGGMSRRPASPNRRANGLGDQRRLVQIGDLALTIKG